MKKSHKNSDGRCTENTVKKSDMSEQPGRLVAQSSFFRNPETHAEAISIKSGEGKAFKKSKLLKDLCSLFLTGQKRAHPKKGTQDTSKILQDFFFR